MRRAVLITIDGWGTNLVGAYGNSLCDTPNLDHFAAHSIVFDRAMACTASFSEGLRAISSGLHPLQFRNPNQLELPELLQAIGKQSIFITDDPVVAELPFVESFNEAFCFDPSDDDSKDITGSVEWENTRLARFAEAALGELSRFCEDSDGLPDLIWLHLSGLTSEWDAPYSYRLALCDEEDPEPTSETEPPIFLVDQSTDPDAIFGVLCGASAQGKVLDQIWGLIDAFFEQFANREERLVILAGIRGYPLGEHTSVGYTGDNLYAEMVHVPLIVQPGVMPLGLRDDSIVQPNSIFKTIIAWLYTERDDHPKLASTLAKRPLLIDLCQASTNTSHPQTTGPLFGLVQSDHNSSLQIPRWTAIWKEADVSPREFLPATTELYLSPDDRWQQNNVTPRALEIAEAMFHAQEAIRNWLQQEPSPNEYPTLAPCLTSPV